MSNADTTELIQRTNQLQHRRIITQWKEKNGNKICTRFRSNTKFVVRTNRVRTHDPVQKLRDEPFKRQRVTD